MRCRIANCGKKAESWVDESTDSQPEDSAEPYVLALRQYQSFMHWVQQTYNNTCREHREYLEAELWREADKI